ncbi:protein of unknown function [Taphrina deformans PYCC 5710]|uniref:Uncharacterized protein n=1 Tax=Taphrina deformans (strain PYCC 5710 / ATCC 11124 / CBS 356.35 / IMI 108563 / JCM 9778 / NBRC 8474) TaxID=1097556 RepID=R4XKD7_TAPDE|nr:protein of unknown function [Taphrina deformans PYCC 5710]|eukprot:CCG84924.1 protein of unknown function [Taphrina deformans PYCC 5710]
MTKKQLSGAAQRAKEAKEQRLRDQQAERDAVCKRQQDQQAERDAIIARSKGQTTGPTPAPIPAPVPAPAQVPASRLAPVSVSASGTNDEIVSDAPKKRKRPVETVDDRAARKQARDTHAAEIESKGVLWDRCESCEHNGKDCWMSTTRGYRQRAYCCSECYRRQKKCSHDLPASSFRAQLAATREIQDREKRALPALARQAAEEEAKRQQAQAKADRKEQLEEQRRQDLLKLKQRELEVRADEAATQREYIGGQLRLAEMHLRGSPKKAGPSLGPIIEEVEE